MLLSLWHRRFKLLLDHMDSGAVPFFDVEEIDEVFNIAIIRFVKRRYNGTDKGRGFEFDQKRIDDLRTLVVENAALSITGLVIDEFGFKKATYTLPANYLFSIREYVNVTYKECGVDKTVDITTIKMQHDALDKALKNPFLQPKGSRVIRLFSGNTITLYYETNVLINNIKISYLKTPAIVKLPATTIESDLPDGTHDEIIAQAVQIALRTTNSPEQLSYEKELLNIE